MKGVVIPLKDNSWNSLFVVGICILFALPANGALIAYWPMDEASGKEVADATGNGHTATFQGKPKWADGKIKGAIEFDGASHLSVQVDNTLESKSVTAAMWVFFNTVNPPRQDFFSKNDDYALTLHEWANDGTIYPVIKTPGGWVVVGGKLKIQEKTWYHVALVYDATSKDLMCYINGNLDSKIAAPGGIEHRGGSLTIGTYQERFLKGKLDEVKIWDEALTEAKIQADMKGPQPVEPRRKVAVLWGQLKAK